MVVLNDVSIIGLRGCNSKPISSVEADCSRLQVHSDDKRVQRNNSVNGKQPNRSDAGSVRSDKFMLGLEVSDGNKRN